MILNFNRSQRLKKEIDNWVQEGIISNEQANTLSERYRLDEEAPWYLRASFMLKGLGLLLVSMGLFLIISQNWDSLGIPFRMMFGLVPLAVAYFFGFYYTNKNNKDNAELAFFFGSIIFGLNIYLQAQIFNISSYYPNGILWWGIGSILPAIYYRSSMHTFLVQGAYIIWISMQLQHNHFSWWAPVLMAVILYLLYIQANGFQLILTNVSVFLLAFNVHYSIYHWRDVEIILLIAGIILINIQLLSRISEQYSERLITGLQNLGGLVLICILYAFTFDDIAEYFSERDIAITSYVALGAAIALYIPFKHLPETTWLYVIAASFLIIQLLEYLLPEADAGFIVANIVFLIHAGWRIWYGVSIREKFHFMAGICLFLLLAITRYIDLFDNYLATAAVFIVGGAGIFGLNSLWNSKYAK